MEKTLTRPKRSASSTLRVGEEAISYRTTRPPSRPSVVQASIQGTSAGAIPSPLLIQSLRDGLPIAELETLRSGLDLPMDKLAPLLGFSKATLHRRKLAGRLDTAESDRVVRFARLLGRAAEVMESLENGRHWLASPQRGLGGATPLEYAETEVGARVVEELLGRIEYGVYT